MLDRRHIYNLICQLSLSLLILIQKNVNSKFKW